MNAALVQSLVPVDSPRQGAKRPRLNPSQPSTPVHSPVRGRPEAAEEHKETRATSWLEAASDTASSKYDDADVDQQSVDAMDVCSQPSTQTRSLSKSVAPQQMSLEQTRRKMVNAEIENQKLRNLIRDEQQKRGRLSKQLESFQSDADKQLHTIRTQLTQYKAQLQQEQQNYKEALTQNTELIRQNTELRQELQVLKQECGAHEDVALRAQERLNSDAGDYNAHIKALQQQNEALAQERDGYKADFQNKKNEFNSLMHDYSRASTQIGQLENDVESYRQKSIADMARIEELERERHELQQEVAAKTDAISVMNQSIEHHRNMVSQLEGQTHQIPLISRQLQVLENEYHNLQNDHNTVTQQLKSEQGRSQALQRSRDELEQAFEKVRSEYQLMRTRFAKLETDQVKVLGENEQWRCHVQQTRDQISTQKATNEALQRDLSARSATIEQLHKAVEAWKLKFTTHEHLSRSKETQHNEDMNRKSDENAALQQKINRAKLQYEDLRQKANVRIHELKAQLSTAMIFRDKDAQKKERDALQKSMTA